LPANDVLIVPQAFDLCVSPEVGDSAKHIPDSIEDLKRFVRL
jgi:hypothetical protein